MPTVTVFLNGRNYDVACGPGEEARVQEVAGRLRQRMEGLAKSLGSVQENLLFAVTSLLLADELEQREREVAERSARLSGKQRWSMCWKISLRKLKLLPRGSRQPKSIPGGELQGAIGHSNPWGQ